MALFWWQFKNDMLHTHRSFKNEQSCWERWYLNNWFICFIFCVKRQRNKVISRQFFNQTYGTLWYNQKYNKYKCNANMSSICLVFICTKMHNSKIWLLVFARNWIIDWWIIFLKSITKANFLFSFKDCTICQICNLLISLLILWNSFSQKYILP